MNLAADQSDLVAHACSRPDREGIRYLAPLSALFSYSSTDVSAQLAGSAVCQSDWGVATAETK